MVEEMRRRGAAVLVAALVSQPIAPVLAAGDDNASHDAKTTTPIKHVIVIIGENRSFDHVYATYKPKNGETVDNLLSKRIIRADGSPGANYSLSGQYSAVDFGGTPDTRWNDDDMHKLGAIKGSDFEVVMHGPITTTQ